MPPNRSKRRAGGPGDRSRVQHMLAAAQDALTHATGRSRIDLDRDKMLLQALLYCIQMIGEAAARVSDAGRQRVPNIPWGSIVAMRHILVHVYHAVDTDAVWGVVENDLPSMVKSLEAALANWPRQTDDPTG